MNRGAVSMLKKIPMLVLAAVVLFPFYICFIYAFKSPSDIVFGKLGLPTQFYLENLKNVMFENPLFFNSMKNSILVTIPVTLVLTFICPMGAYVLARNNKRGYRMIYTLFLASILIPFQSIMLPLYLNLKMFDLVNTLFGFIVVKIGFTTAFNILVITSFVKTIPIVLEESASIEGAGRFRTFWSIVFPMMQPVNMTMLVLNVLFTWNDFNIALIVLQKSRVRTLPMAQFIYFGENTTDLHSAFAFATLSIIPVIILYLCFQKYIVEGIVAGAVKG